MLGASVHNIMAPMVSQSVCIQSSFPGDFLVYVTIDHILTQDVMHTNSLV